MKAYQYVLIVPGAVTGTRFLAQSPGNRKVVVTENLNEARTYPTRYRALMAAQTLEMIFGRSQPVKLEVRAVEVSLTECDHEANFREDRKKSKATPVDELPEITYVSASPDESSGIA